MKETVGMSDSWRRIWKIYYMRTAFSLDLSISSHKYTIRENDSLIFNPFVSAYRSGNKAGILQ